MKALIDFQANFNEFEQQMLFTMINIIIAFKFHILRYMFISALFVLFSIKTGRGRHIELEKCEEQPKKTST